MRVTDHLQELRKRILIVLVWFIVALAAAFPFVRPIYRYLVRDVEDKLAILGPADIVWVYLMIAGVLAIAASIPVAGVQAWLFVKPALDTTERRATLSYIPAMAMLFLAGLCFGYFVVFPMVFSFLHQMATDEFLTLYTANRYFSFLFNLTVPLGALFEMPVVILFLTRLGILNPTRLARTRKVSYFTLIVIAVLLTPPDLVSDILVIVPLLLLYEASVALSSYAYRKKARTESQT